MHIRLTLALLFAIFAQLALLANNSLPPDCDTIYLRDGRVFSVRIQHLYQDQIQFTFCDHNILQYYTIPKINISKIILNKGETRTKESPESPITISPSSEIAVFKQDSVSFLKVLYGIGTKPEYIRILKKDADTIEYVTYLAPEIIKKISVRDFDQKFQVESNYQTEATLNFPRVVKKTEPAPEPPQKERPRIFTHKLGDYLIALGALLLIITLAIAVI